MSGGKIFKAYSVRLGVAFLATAVTGCATSTQEWTPPTKTEITNERLIESPFGETWDRLVHNISMDFFVINNIEKSSRIINVSFSTPKPSQFLDCGFTTRIFKSGGSTETTYYASANSADFRLPNDTLYPTRMHRRTELEGRANIYVAPKETKTIVAVNAKYILTVKQTYDRFYNFQWHTSSLPDVNKITQTAVPSSGDDWYCVSTGVLEERLLSAAELK